MAQTADLLRRLGGIATIQRGSIQAYLLYILAIRIVLLLWR